jgi:hypothetical protein
VARVADALRNSMKHRVRAPREATRTWGVDHHGTICQLRSGLISLHSWSVSGLEQHALCCTQALCDCSPYNCNMLQMLRQHVQQAHRR